MVDWKMSEDDSRRLVERYEQLRRIAWKLSNEVLPKYVPTPGIEACAKKLGLWHRGGLVLEHDDEICVLMDCSIHDFRPKLGTAVEQHMVEARPAGDSDESVVLQAMRESFYTLVQVTEVLPEVGVRLADLLAEGCEYLMVDIGFGSSAHVGGMLATRILSYGPFVTTSGAALPVDLDTLAEIRRSILPHHGIDKDGRCQFHGGRQRAAELAMAIVRVCLRRHAMDRIRYAGGPWSR
jgi:hypothetical protein